MPRHARPRAATTVAALVALLASLSLAVAPATAAPDYRLPVDTTVARAFDGPSTPYGAGHRGVDLVATPGTRVAAAADGEVTYAQDVAGTTWVTVEHPDGVTTSYGPLTAVRLAPGDRVTGGSRLGEVAGGGHGRDDTDDGLHWGARKGGDYLDPMTLLGPAKLPTLVGVGGWHGSDPAVERYEPWRGARYDGIGIHDSPRADRPGFAVPPNPNHLLLVGGLNSSTHSPLLDPSHLGYGDDSWTRYSYAGVDADGRPLAYGPDDTWDGIDAAARRLAEQLRAQQRRQPFRAVDLVGHSQGGVVILHYLANYHEPFDPTTPPIGNVVTIAAPHQGSDTASLTRAVRDHYITGTAAAAGLYAFDRDNERWRGAVGTPLEELRVRSPFLRELATDWETAVESREAGPLATGTRVLTLGGSGDRIVGTHRASPPTGVDGDGVVLPHRVLPGNHDGVLHTEAIREVTYRFLRGDPVPESPAHLQTAISGLNGTTQRYIGHGLQLHDLSSMARSALRATRTPPTVPGR